MDAVNTLTIKGALLRWARESARISLREASRSFGISVPTLARWESSSAKVTPHLLERIADTYKRSTAVFFMPAAPREPPTPVDFRVRSVGTSLALSHKTILALRRARRLQRIFSELISEDRMATEARLLPLTIDSDIQAAAAAARAFLGASLSEQVAYKKPWVALPIWRRKIENTGVLVFQFAMPLKETRGFSLPDSGAPVIVLNSADEAAGRVFTLFHEWGHLCIGQPGLCNPNTGTRAAHQGRAEAFCNRFAGSFLVPPDALLNLKPVSRYRERKVSLSYALGRIAGYFAVSRYVALEALARQDVVPEDDLDSMRRLLAAHAISLLKRRSETSSGGWTPWPERSLLQLGSRFVSTVLEAHERGLVTHADVSDYLSVKLKHLERVQELLPAA